MSEDKIELRESGPNLSNTSTNKKRSKRREFNDFGLVTRLVKEYKESNDPNDLLEVLKALEGIINTFTIILSPGDVNQQIHLNPYMKKFLGMFLSPAEQQHANIQTYMQAVYRVRWIMRHYTYDDVYSKVIEILIQIIQSMKIVGTCDCIYYIQLVTKFKMHDWVIKTGRDVITDVKEMPVDYNSGGEENFEDVMDRITFNPENIYYEDQLIQSMYDEVGVSVLVKDTDIFKCFSHYEKYVIYLHDYLGLTDRQILSILRFEDADELEERIEDIRYKLELINREGD